MLTAENINDTLHTGVRKPGFCLLLWKMSNFVLQPRIMNPANWIFRTKTKHGPSSCKSGSWCSVGRVHGFIKEAHEDLICPQTQIFSLNSYKKNFSPYFDCQPQVSEVYPAQQYPIVCLQDEHRSCFSVKPRLHSHASSTSLQTGLFYGDKLTAADRALCRDEVLHKCYHSFN